MTAIPVEERQHWIGASEVAALFDMSRFKTRFQLWHEKTGTLPPPDLSDNDRVMAGRHLETGIASWAAEKWEWPIIGIDDYSPHPTVERLGASLDFHGEDGDPIEIKCIDYGIFRDNWIAEQDTITDAPLDYVIQVQAQMACRPGTDRGWLVACVGGNKIYRMEIPRHEAMIQRIEQETQLFWESIRNGIPPAPNFELDANTIGLLYAGKEGAGIDLTGDPRALELARQYKSFGAIESEARKSKSKAMGELKAMIGEATVATIAEGYTLRASHIAGGTYERKPSWRFTLSQSKPKGDKTE